MPYRSHHSYILSCHFTGTLIAIPVARRKRNIAFKMVRIPKAAGNDVSKNMEWELPLNKNKAAQLSDTTDGEVLVSQWNDPAVYKTGNGR